MAELAPLLRGEFDFRAFAAADDKYGKDEPLVRRIFDSSIERTGDLMLYRVRGSGFLKHMVRNIVGMLLEAGKGNLGREELESMLEFGAKRKAGPTAPPRGLFLMSVEY